MDSEYYMELYEAVYFFSRIYGFANYTIPRKINKEEMNLLGFGESFVQATIRILVVNHLLDYDDHCFTIANEEKHRWILDTVISKNQKNYTEMLNKAVNENEFFFEDISETEYEVYSRYNFQITFETGKEVAKHINLANKKVLELGGNSGGLGTALLAKNKNCHYTVVDTKIPCIIGNEIKKVNQVPITFIEGNIFGLMLPDEVYDFVILMNLLHDFEDSKCLDILRNCIRYCHRRTKFLIIEDILTGEFEPKEAIMHGLRLSVYCRGGKQRTIEEFKSLFSGINYKVEKTIKLSSVHMMLVLGTMDEQPR